MCAIIQKNLKSWEDYLPHVKFAYNRTVHSTTHYSPFEIVYGFNPLTPLDLLPLPMSERVNMDGLKQAEQLHALHQKVRDNIEKITFQFIRHANKGRQKMIFESGDWVWIHMRKESSRYNDATNSCLEVMDLSKWWSALMIMLTSWTYQVSTVSTQLSI